ncbi:hypothetical protein ACIQD3_15055 [Peribacillus loiseleuriae]|uniref:hypothetical protein n=1 Tax=Peribacillus loiseleuriae TaxID=1679170 RepID=UPI00381E76F7
MISQIPRDGARAIPNVSFILLLRLVHGIGWAITTTSYGTIVSEMVSDQRRGEGWVILDYPKPLPSNSIQQQKKIYY